jgi:ABC-type antimicrobial peptide transport system permease subunit
MIFLSVALLIAAAASMLYHYIPDPDKYIDFQVNVWGNMSLNAYGLNGPAARDLRPNAAAHPDAAKPSPHDVSDLPISMALESVFPYSLFSLPLATIGIIALVSGVYLYRKGVWLRASKDRQRLRAYWRSQEEKNLASCSTEHDI